MKSQKYFCHGCHELFEVHCSKCDRKQKQPYCTGCGEDLDVKVYREPPKRKRKYQNWTDKDMKKLKELMNQGLQNRTIAYIMGRSIDAVRLKVHRVRKDDEDVVG